MITTAFATHTPALQHFNFLEKTITDNLFFKPSEILTRYSPRENLADALGATLYSPATRENLVKDLETAYNNGVFCSVLCLEDAIADSDVAQGEENIIHTLQHLYTHETARPLVFIRVRNSEQITDLVARAGHAASMIDGFVIPKFTATSGEVYLNALVEASLESNNFFYAMVVIESPEVFAAELRIPTLVGIRELLNYHRERILAVRIGATDLSSQLGIRRNHDLTIYDVAPIAHIISDIVNILGRVDGTGFRVTGAVWEHFESNPRMFKPQLRESTFSSSASKTLRRNLIGSGLDGLLREISLDHACGILGKTVIHPSHVAPVHALSVVSFEDYHDALDIVAAADKGGVAASIRRNKMNEANPHHAWAQATLQRAKAFGVAHEHVTIVDLLEAITSAKGDK